jgi:hypothetical protein
VAGAPAPSSASWDVWMALRRVYRGIAAVSRLRGLAVAGCLVARLPGCQSGSGSASAIVEIARCETATPRPATIRQPGNQPTRQPDNQTQPRHASCHNDRYCRIRIHTDGNLSGSYIRKVEVPYGMPYSSHQGPVRVGHLAERNDGPDESMGLRSLSKFCRLPSPTPVDLHRTLLFQARRTSRRAKYTAPPAPTIATITTSTVAVAEKRNG